MDLVRKHLFVDSYMYIDTRLNLCQSLFQKKTNSLSHMPKPLATIIYHTLRVAPVVTLIDPLKTEPFKEPSVGS